MSEVAKSKWEQVKEKLILVEGWARDGLTNEQIAKNLGINPDTLYKYQKEHPEFSEALKKGKEIADYEVENALYKRAIGYMYDEITKEIKEDGKKVVKVVTKQVIPDTTAQIFWLKNRKPKQWKDKIDVEDEANKETLKKLDEVLKGLGGVI